MDIQQPATLAESRKAPIVVGSGALSGFPPVLDVCCGSRMMWYDKADNRAMYADKRRETWAADLGTESTKGRTPIVINPDIVADFTNLPFPSDAFCARRIRPAAHRETGRNCRTADKEIWKPHR